MVNSLFLKKGFIGSNLQHHFKNNEMEGASYFKLEMYLFRNAQHVEMEKY